LTRRFSQFFCKKWISVRAARAVSLPEDVGPAR
jgi:hypothetical protein